MPIPGWDAGTYYSVPDTTDLGPNYHCIKSRSEYPIAVVDEALCSRPLPQYLVEKRYALDFALIEGDRRLAIEVDGERYHRNWDGELCRRDQIRNERLMELGGM